MLANGQICSAGQQQLEVGEVILAELLATRQGVVVVDINEERLEQLRATHGVPTIHGDATTDEVLTQAGISRAAGLAAVVDTVAMPKL